MGHWDFVGLLGRTWDKLWPKKVIPPLPALQPRDHALRILFDYLATVDWEYEDANGLIKKFNIPRDQMFEEKPDDNTTMKMPCLVVDPGKGSHVDDDPPLGPPVPIENTYDGNTALIEIGLYIETFKLEVWTTSPLVRRAIAAGLDVVMSPTGDYWGCSLVMPNYYDISVWFGLNSTTRYDDVQIASRRRWAVCEIEMWVPLVQRVPVGLFEPHVVVRVDRTNEDASDP